MECWIGSQFHVYLAEGGGCAEPPAGTTVSADPFLIESLVHLSHWEAGPQDRDCPLSAGSSPAPGVQLEPGAYLLLRGGGEAPGELSTVPGAPHTCDRWSRCPEPWARGCLGPDPVHFPCLVVGASLSVCLSVSRSHLSVSPPTPLPPSFSSLGLRLPGCLAAWLSLIARPSWLLSRFLSSSSPDLRSVWSSILLPLSSLCLSALGGPPPSSLPISLPFKCKQERTAVHRSGDPPTLGCQGAGAQEGAEGSLP